MLKLKLSLMVAITMLLSACATNQSEFTDLQEKLDEIRKNPPGKIDPLPEFRVYEVYKYSASLLRSPFQPPIAVDQVDFTPQGKKVEPDFTRIKELLEDQSIESLSMVGTIRKPNEPSYALLRDSGARVHRVRIGNFVGKNHGRIIAVEDVKLDIVELIPDGQDGWVERPRSIVLVSGEE